MNNMNKRNNSAISDENSETVIYVKDITRKFGNTVAVDNISFSVKKGQIFGLLGPNGSGKTTTIKVLTGQIKPTTGTSRIMGMDSLENSMEIRRITGIIPEQETPPSFLTGEEYLNFVAKIRNIADMEAKIDKWFEFLDFDNERNTLCKDMSRGTRQKLMFSQAFLDEPELVFIDEPLINLDPVIQKKVKDYLKKYVLSGNTVFISTHILEIANDICTHMGILNRGKMVYCGDKKSITGDGKLEDKFIELIERTDASENRKKEYTEEE